MAPTATKSTGTRVQTWLPQGLAEQLRAQAELERRSVSSVVRLAVEDVLRKGRTDHDHRLAREQLNPSPLT